MKIILFFLIASTFTYYSQGGVCGEDGVTYEDPGDCYHKGIKVIHVGPCLSKAIDRVWWKHTDDHGNWNRKNFIPWNSLLTRIDTGNPYQHEFHTHKSAGFGHHHHDHSHHNKVPY